MTKLIRDYQITNASVHDSIVFKDILVLQQVGFDEYRLYIDRSMFVTEELADF